MITTLLIVNAVWVMYAMLEGFREGFYWFFKMNSRRKSDFEIHPAFMIQRGIVIFLIALVVLSYVSIWQMLIIMLSISMIFSYFHNGSYYLTRHKLDSKTYPMGWKSQSSTSTAKLTKFMTYRNRTILMIAGYIIQIAVCMFL